MTKRDELTRARAYLEYWANKNRGFNINSINKLILDYEEEVMAFNYAERKAAAVTGAKPNLIRPILKYSLEAALYEQVDTIPGLIREEIARDFRCKAEDLEPLKTWIKAVTGSLENDDLYIMAHWLWLVKRNSQSLPVVHHVVPILTSPKQGGGKSTAIKELLRPLESSTLELKVPQVVDERSFTLFNKYLVGFLDELAGAEKVEIADFKRNVTSSTIAYRPMKTNAIVKITNLCSFIGASNNQIYEIIKDTTGIRRFFPITSLDALDWDAINNLDYLALWRGIDETKERGYYELVKKTVAERQEEMQMKDEVNLFIENYGVLPTGPTEVVNGKKLYQEYVFHTKNEGIRFQVAAQTFYKKLRDMGLQAVKKKDENKIICWFFAINPDAAAMLKGSKYDN